jgi:ankyrin repeat protein
MRPFKAFPGVSHGDQRSDVTGQKGEAWRPEARSQRLRHGALPSSILPLASFLLRLSASLYVPTFLLLVPNVRIFFSTLRVESVLPGGILTRECLNPIPLVSCFPDMRKIYCLSLYALCLLFVPLTQLALSQPLVEAVKLHNLEKVKAILSSPVDVNQRGPGGVTALLAAVRSRDVAICKELLEHGADPNASDSASMTPLAEASVRGSYDLVDCLLKKGADAHLSARMTAGSDGEPLSNPGLVFSQPSTRIQAVEKNPLILACEGAHMAVARLLLERGADVNRQAEWLVTTQDAQYSIKGRTALMCAVQNRFSGLARLLIEKGADLSAQEQATAMALTVDGVGRQENPGSALPPLFVKHSTALHIAAERCDQVTAGILLAAGAGLEMKDGLDATPLSSAIRSGCTPMAEMFIQRGANVNAGKNTPLSPLVLAAQRGKLWLVELLVNAGASVDQKTGKDDFPLISWAVMGGNRQVARVLLEHGADVNAATRNHSTPLMIAAGEGEANIVRFLIAQKARLDLKNDEGQTALIIASRRGRADCVQGLLAGGAVDTIHDKSGRTALAYAVQDANQRIARLLREGGVASGEGPSLENERLLDLIEYFSDEIDRHYYSEAQVLALAKPYGKWDTRPFHIASLPHPEGDGIMSASQVPEFVWEVVAHHDFNLPRETARKVRDAFIKEGFAHKQRYCTNFYPSRRSAFLALSQQAAQNTRSVYVQQRELARGQAYERVDNIYRQNGTYWRYTVPFGSPFQMSPKIDTVRGYQYPSSDESILQGLHGAGCYCMAKVSGYIVFMTGGVLDNSIGFIYGKSRPKRDSLGPLFNLTLVEELGDGFYYYVSH